MSTTLNIDPVELESLCLVGEASSKVSAAGRKGLPNVPWAQLVDMRNRLIHAYFDINRNVWWSTVTVAMPSLLIR